MFQDLVDAIAEYPYIGVALVFLLCGLGFPLPEEIVLLAGGYICAKFPETASLHWMMCWCAGAILVGDSLPYVLGRVFGTKLLRLRPLRMVVTKRRLAQFDRWFRRRGEMVIFIARFLPGIRVVAFFTSGTMKMPLRRFLLLDLLGILMLVPLLNYLGYHSAAVIDDLVARIQQLERGLLWSMAAGAIALGIWYWLFRRRRAQQRRQAHPIEAFVEPTVPPAGATGAAADWDAGQADADTGTVEPAAADAPPDATSDNPHSGTGPQPPERA